MTMRETFALDEGEVTLSYPAELSPESYQDMADRIEILLRGLKRRADAEAARRRTERAGGDGKGPAPDMSPSYSATLSRTVTRPH